MKFLSALVLGAATSTVMASPVPNNVDAGKFLIELAPGETRWVTETEKTKLRKVCRRFRTVRYRHDIEADRYPKRMEPTSLISPRRARRQTPSSTPSRRLLPTQQSFSIRMLSTPCLRTCQPPVWRKASRSSRRTTTGTTNPTPVSSLPIGFSTKSTRS